MFLKKLECKFLKIKEYVLTDLIESWDNEVKSISDVFKIFLFSTLLLISNVSYAELTGAWTGSGFNWEAVTPSGDVKVITTASGSMGGFTTATIGCAGSYSLGAVDNHAALQFYHDLLDDPGSITFSFVDSSNNPIEVVDPIINIDRVGGAQGTTSNSSLWTLAGGLTWVELTQNDVHFESTATTLYRTLNASLTGTNTECGAPNVGTASGSMQIQGEISSFTLNATRPVGAIGTLGDEIEVVFSGLVKKSTLTLKKSVTNDHGGTATISNFTLSFDNGAGVTGSGSDGDPLVTDVTVPAGTYTLSENSLSGYKLDSIVCDGTDTNGSDGLTLGTGEEVTCTFNNNDLGVDLSMVKTVNNATPNIGDTVTFSLVVNNAGPDTATNAAVSDIVPSGFTYVANTIGGGDTQDDSDPTGSSLSWTINSLASGASTTLTFVATVDAP